MKNSHVVVVVALAMCMATLHALADTVPGPQDAERAAIEKAVRDYIDGWYEGSAERMARALHPDLAKRRMVPLPNGRQILDTASADVMIEATRAGFGKQKARSDQQNQVIILDLIGNMAAVKTISPDFIDLLHLAKANGEWRIVNVLWESVQPPSAGK